MKLRTIVFVFCIALLFAGGCAVDGAGKKGLYRWEVHDTNRPQPRIVTPSGQIGGAPSDAIVLFDGTDMSKWVCDKNDGVVRCKVENGYFELNKTGNLFTRQSFGDCQFHIEWASPMKVAKDGQYRGNSGVFLMSKYEIQMLDSYDNITYPDGQAGAMYGQYPPLVNASLPPGKWQSYDIIFRRPVFGKKGKLIRPGTMTLFHNGILVQGNAEIQGATIFKKRAKYTAHPDKLPIKLQDHNDPVRFRNIWIRELAEK